MKPASSRIAAELAPTGTIRAAINLANKALVQGEEGCLRGKAIDMAHAIARASGLPIAFSCYPSAHSVFEALDANDWDIAFMAADPSRAQRLHFTPPYVTIEARFAVRADANLGIADIDRPGMRIATSRGAAYDLHLGRVLKYAQRVQYETPVQSFEGFARDEADAVAGIREALSAFQLQRDGLRQLEEPFLVIGQTIAIRRECVSAASFLDELVDTLKAGNP